MLSDKTSSTVDITNPAMMPAITKYTFAGYLIHKNTMNKASIVDKVNGILGGTKADAERAVDCVIDSIVEGLKSGDEVSLAGLGIFSTKMRPARQGRNPRTGETIQIQAMRVPKFRAAKALKDAVR